MTKNDRNLIAIFSTLLLGTIVASCAQRDDTDARRTQATTAPAPVVAAKESQAPKYTTRELLLHSMADAAADKSRTVLFRSRNAPGVKLYSTQATHPACEVNGKPMQVAEVGNGGFTCYRWIGDTVALRIEGNQFAMLSGEDFGVK